MHSVTAKAATDKLNTVYMRGEIRRQLIAKKDAGEINAVEYRAIIDRLNECANTPAALKRLITLEVEKYDFDFLKIIYTEGYSIIAGKIISNFAPLN